MASEEPLLKLDSPTSEKKDGLSKLKKDLEGYRELLIPINKFLEWEQNYYPAIIFGVITLFFAIIWYLDPSVLTSVCLIGIVLCTVDFAVPALTGVLFSGSEWNESKEEQFEAICQRLLNAKNHVMCAKNYLGKLKEEKPKVYMIGMMGAFACLAWFGSCIDNLFLTYLIVLGVALCPGVRKSGLLDKVIEQIKEKISGMKNKSKTN